MREPPQTGVKETSAQKNSLNILNAEVEELFKKDAIETVPMNEIQAGFYSTFFLVPKMRPVLNQRPLNRYLQKNHFKMDTMSKVLNLVKPKDWAISLDLTEAYLHIPLFPKHRKYLEVRFCIAGQCFQWKCLCFGPTSAPRVFTKIVSVVAAHLRAQNIRLASYLDDWLAVNQIRRQLLQDREKRSKSFDITRFYNQQRKVRANSKATNHIHRGLFLFDQEIVTPTPDRIRKLESAVKNIYQGHNQAKDFLHLLGIIASCLELIPNARLFMRLIQLHLLCFWKPSSLDLEIRIPVTQHLKSHLQWWLTSVNTMRGRSLHQQQTNITITTDASKIG